MYSQYYLRPVQDVDVLSQDELDELWVSSHPPPPHHHPLPPQAMDHGLYIQYYLRPVKNVNALSQEELHELRVLYGLVLCGSVCVCFD